MICSKCKAKHKRKGQRYCAACHRAANKKYRQKRRVLLWEIRDIVLNPKNFERGRIRLSASRRLVKIVGGAA